MSANTPSSRAYDAALARMSSVLDAAAQKEQVPPDEFRAAIGEALIYATQCERALPASPEAFVLSLVSRLF